MRGPGGGYLLGKDAGEIAVGAVITAVDESVDATRCRGKEGCQGGDRCLTHALWRDLSERISGFLNNITLAELVNNREVLVVADRQNNDTRRTPTVVRKKLSTLICAHKQLAKFLVFGSDVRSTRAMKLPIYLDYSATTPVDPRVAEKMMQFLTPTALSATRLPVPTVSVGRRKRR